jgi:5-methylcytosine-specific restriction endonuclease McrA
MDKPRKSQGTGLTKEEMERFAQRVRLERMERLKGYREQSLRIHPWVCARCGRQFTHKNLHQLTIHHKDHNHDNNPPDGSNWEHLCPYCHDNEHGRYLDDIPDENNGIIQEPAGHVTHKPFAALADMLKEKKKEKI